MHDELIIVVLVQALESRAVAANAVHARGRVACELDPLRLKGVKLRMNDGAREGNRTPASSIRPPHHEARFRAAFECGRDPLAVGRERALAELCAFEAA